MKNKLIAIVVVALTAGCSKETTSGQTPAEICDEALAKGVIEQACTNNPGSPYPGSRNLTIKFAGEDTYVIVLEAAPSIDLLEKLEVDNKKVLLSNSSLTAAELAFYADRKRRLLLTVAQMFAHPEAKPKLDRFIKFVNPER